MHHLSYMCELKPYFYAPREECIKGREPGWNTKHWLQRSGSNIVAEQSYAGCHRRVFKICLWICLSWRDQLSWPTVFNEWNARFYPLVQIKSVYTPNISKNLLQYLALGLKPANYRIIPSENVKLSCITVWWKVVRMGLKSRNLDLWKNVLLCALHSSTSFQGIKFSFSRTTLPSQATFAECKHLAGLAVKSGAGFASYVVWIARELFKPSKYSWRLVL